MFLTHTNQHCRWWRTAKRGCVITLLEWCQGESPRFLLSLQSSVTGGPGDLVAVLCILTIRCHPFSFNQFPAFCPYSEHTKLVLFFKRSIYFFASAKIWPTTRSHLKGTNALHPATSKLLAKTGNFQGLAPVYKELLVKACNRKCTFLPWAKNYDSWKSEKHSEGKSQKSEFSCLLPSTSHSWWLHLGLNVHPATLCNLSNVFSSRELTATAWAVVVLGKLQLLYAASF